MATKFPSKKIKMKMQFSAHQIVTHDPALNNLVATKSPSIKKKNLVATKLVDLRRIGKKNLMATKSFFFWFIFFIWRPGGY
jgi:hypothetical protein